MFWPFWRPRTDPADRLTALERALNDALARLETVERGITALRGDMLAWEAAAAKATRELSRHLKALAEVERRERIKAVAEEIEDEEEDLLTRTRRFASGK